MNFEVNRAVRIAARKLIIQDQTPRHVIFFGQPSALAIKLLDKVKHELGTNLGAAKHTAR